MRDLQLNNNQIQELPQEITDLPLLDFIDVTENQLTSLPIGMSKLKKLTMLHLSENQLSETSDIIEITKITGRISQKGFYAIF